MWSFCSPSPQLIYLFLRSNTTLLLKLVIRRKWMPISSRFGNAISFCNSSTDRRSRRLNFCHTAPNDSGDAEGFDIMGLIFSVTTYPPSSLDCWWYTQIVAYSARVSLASIDQSLISCRNQFLEIFPCHLVSSTSSILYTAWHQIPVSKKQWNLSLAKRCNCCNKLFEREEFFCCVNHLCCVIIKHKEAATASAAALEQAAKKYVLHEWIRVSEAYLQDISQVILQLFEFVKHAKNYGAHTTLHV